MKQDRRPRLKRRMWLAKTAARSTSSAITTASSTAAENSRDVVPRIDAAAKVTGEARYAADIHIENITSATLVTSAVAKGRISKLRLRAARAVPGVLDILTYRDGRTIKALRSIRGDDNTIRPMASARIWHDGQIIALVVAESAEAACEAAYKIDVVYKAKRPSATFGSRGTRTEAASTAAKDHKDPCVGQAAAAFKVSEAKVDVRYTTAAHHHNPMELFSTTCVWKGHKLAIYEPSQFANGLRRSVADQLKIKFGDIRVVSGFVGGAFGSKGSTTARTALIAVAAGCLRRPVRLVATRDQGFTIASYRGETKHHAKLGANRDGKLRALIHRGWEISSRPDSYFNGGTDTTCRMYAYANVSSKVLIVHADRNTPGYMRAPGEFPYVYALETAMDELALELGIDPIELRRRNDTMSDPISGAPYSSRSLMRCFDQAAKAFGWRGRAANPGTMRDGDWLVGWGCAAGAYPTQMSPAAVRVTLTRGGEAVVEMAVHEFGNGAMTVMAQTAAEGLGIDVENVRVVMGDSRLPPGPMGASSATTASVCSVIPLACNAIMGKLGNAGHKGALEAKFDQLGVGSVSKSAVWIPPGLDPSACKDLFNGGANFYGGATADRLLYAFGAQIAEVRIHAQTREIRVPRIVGAFAAGRIVNARTAKSQLKGGMIWGIGSALHDQTVVDRRRARYVNHNISDYLVPVNADIRAVEVILVPEQDPAVNPAGVKGIGELGIVGTAAAISNAVFHATGRRIRQLPIRVEHLL